MNPLEAAAARNRWAHRATGEKILLFGGLLLCAVALPPFPGATAVLVVVLAVAFLGAAVPPRLLGVLAAGPLVFIGLGVLPLFVSVSAAGIGWDPEGPRRAAEVAMRASAAVLCTLAFAATTPLGDLLAWLRRRGVPGAVCHVADLTYRMVSTLMETVRVTYQAQAARLGHRTRRAMVRDTAGQMAAVFVRAMETARGLEEGLALRAEPGSMATLSRRRAVSPAFVVATLALLAVVIAVGVSGAGEGWSPW